MKRDYILPCIIAVSLGLIILGLNLQLDQKETEIAALQSLIDDMEIEFENRCDDEYSEGYDTGYSDGYEDGWDDGCSVGYGDGYEDGYSDGLLDRITN